jgi:hypothetical protein
LERQRSANDGEVGANRKEENKMTDIRLFNIENGNTCSLCEKQLNWLKSPIEPIALTTKRAICLECYNKLKEKYK